MVRRRPFTNYSLFYGFMPLPRKKSCGADHPWNRAMCIRYLRPDTSPKGCPIFWLTMRGQLLAAILATLLFIDSVEARTAAEAQALAECAVLHIQAVGRDKAFADFSAPAAALWTASCISSARMPAVSWLPTAATR
jgi:hypothetical protein